MKRILAIAPHPDDEILGCGGTLARHVRNGDQVYVVIVTRGTPKLYKDQQIENVRNEARAAHGIIGVKETVFLDFHAPELDITSQADISRALSKCIQQFKIDCLYLPHRGDIHHDHAAVFNAGLVAARPLEDYTVKQIYTYETLSETEWAPPFGNDVFIPTVFSELTNHDFEAKIEAMKCFKSQLKSFPNPRSIDNLKALAMFRGATVGVRLAEAFMQIRSII